MAVFSLSFHKQRGSHGDVAGGDSWERSPDKCKVLDNAANSPEARNKCWPSYDANVTALETIMALAAVVERMPLRDPLLLQSGGKGAIPANGEIERRLGKPLLRHRSSSAHLGRNPRIRPIATVVTTGSACACLISGRDDLQRFFRGQPPLVSKLLLYNLGRIGSAQDPVLPATPYCYLARAS
jgi:hypothetical protein